MDSNHTERSDTVDVDGTITRPRNGSVLYRTEATPWQHENEDGFAYKTLFEDPKTHQTTVLMRVEAGALAGSHAHDQLEQVLVLEGTFYDDDRTYGPGDFIVRAPGAMHTGGSKTGALVLLIYSA